ncbi:hypothetical protein BJV78DRAFT_1260449 [Lactifluus subvellereus]|nr:hypothetical protein BJV78DRAFT_1260449 [Lactifluus subvellereus]
MVNWNDPSVLLKDYLAMIKLDHAIAGIYIAHRCELTTSVGRPCLLQALSWTS